MQESDLLRALDSPGGKLQLTLEEFDKLTKVGKEEYSMLQVVEARQGVLPFKGDHPFRMGWDATLMVIMVSAPLHPSC